MFLNTILPLFLFIGGVLSFTTDCSWRNRALSRDGFTCYDCGKSTRFGNENLLQSGDKKLTSPEEFPWHASIYINNSTQWYREDWIYHCGATLISSHIVVTAASCVSPIQVKKSDLRVVLGKGNIMWNMKSSSEIKRKVEKVIIHPDYMRMPSNYSNDIAMLVLDFKVFFTNSVAPACLDFGLNTLPPNNKSAYGFISGFVLPEDCGSRCFAVSKKLQYTGSKIMSYEECLNKTHIPRSFLNATLTPDKFCVGNDTATAFLNSKGGDGVTIIHQGLHYLTGVTTPEMKNFTYNPLHHRFGGVSNITYYMNWIKGNIPWYD